MRVASRQKAVAFFVVLGSCLVALAVALNISWVILNWREGVLLLFGVTFFAAIIAGMILNTLFLVREIRSNEQHDSFLNSVTHELKTPIASIRLYLEPLQRRIGRNREPCGRFRNKRFPALGAAVDGVIRRRSCAHHEEPDNVRAVSGRSHHQVHKGMARPITPARFTGPK